MKEQIRALLDDLDRALFEAVGGRTLSLYHIGRSALVWAYGSLAKTRDIDVLQPTGADDLVQLALAQFGVGSAKAIEHGLFLEMVPDGLPPVPAGYEKRARPVSGTWQVLRVFHLDPHDLAATKLRRFSAKDRADIRELCDMGLLDSSILEEVLEMAFRWSLDKDGDPHRDAAFNNLRTVQRYLHGDVAEF